MRPGGLYAWSGGRGDEGRSNIFSHQPEVLGPNLVCSHSVCNALLCVRFISSLNSKKTEFTIRPPILSPRTRNATERLCVSSVSHANGGDDDDDDLHFFLVNIWRRSGDFPATFRLPSGDLPATFRRPSGFLAARFRPPSSGVPQLCGDLLATFGDLPATV